MWWCLLAACRLVLGRSTVRSVVRCVCVLRFRRSAPSAGEGEGGFKRVYATNGICLSASQGIAIEASVGKGEKGGRR